MGLALVSAACALILFRTPNPQRARNIIATLLTLLAASYIPAIWGIAHGTYHLANTNILNPFVLTAANIFALLILLYPIEVIRPGWLNTKRVGLLTIPFIVITLIYTIGTILGHDSIIHLSSITQLDENAHIFNVWARFLLLLDALGYIAAAIYFVAKYSPSYMEWCENNFSSLAGLSITWIANFTYGVLLLTILFCIMAVTGSPVALLVYQIALLMAIVGITNRAIFQTNAYPENYFSESLDQQEVLQQSAEAEQRRLGVYPITHGSSNPNANSDNASDGADSGFDGSIQSFTEQIKDWFESERPYRQPGFQLSDVGAKIPVCRTYLSRIFNEGFGDSFSHVVRDYRLRDAEDMLRNRPEMSAADIAAECGFSNPAAFSRTFSAAHDGLTPGKFRTEMQENNPAEAI